MNCLLLFQSELINPERAIIQGKRVSEITEAHALRVGIQLKLAVFEKGIGHGKIEALNDKKIEISLSLGAAIPPRENINLIVAVPRPQTVKKIAHLAGSFGVKTLKFIAADNSEKSYLQSKALGEINLQKEMQLAIEQSVDCFIPEAKVYHSYRAFLSELTGAEFKKAQKIFADVPRLGKRKTRNPKMEINKNQEVYLAIGPEAGWSDKEREDFKKLGFKVHSLGERIFRSDHALAMLLGRVSR